MAGHDVPPDDSEDTSESSSRSLPRPPAARAPIPRPAARAPANVPRPSSLTNFAPPPRPSSVAVPAPPPQRPTPTGTPAPPISRKVPRPATQSNPAVRAHVPATRPPPQQQPTSQPPIKGAGIELAIGQLFAKRYRIDKQVGKGGMGAVYLATQEPLQRMVAIKVLHGTADTTTVARFQREARLIAQLQHPHIVGLIDFGEDQGRLYLVMEYIDGESLTNVMQNEAPFDPARVVDVALQIAEALAVAHDMSVVHRDVKPDNIMLLKTAGGQDFVKMLDFGVAKIKRDGEAQANNTVETKAGLIVGSLRYISPEQVENGEITPRTDIYSFGCVVYEMLAGRRVFDYASPADCAIAHITEEPKPPEVDGQVLAGPLVDFIMRCLSKKAPGRPANAREAIAALQACRQAPITTSSRAARPALGALGDTVEHAIGGLDRAQSAQTIASVDPGPTARATPGPGPQGPRSLDSQIRPTRPSGVNKFEIVGGAGDGSGTSTHLQGVRLQPRAQEVAPKSRTWLWILVGFLALATGFITVFLINQKPSGASDSLPVEASADVTSGPDDPSDVAASPAAAEVAAADASEQTPDVDAAPEVSSDAGPGDVSVITDPQRGAMVKTDPPGATILMNKKVLCTTPCVVPWGEGEPPPLVRVRLKGHIDVDLQFVNADRGTEQSLTLRKQP